MQDHERSISFVRCVASVARPRGSLTFLTVSTSSLSVSACRRVATLSCQQTLLRLPASGQHNCSNAANHRQERGGHGRQQVRSLLFVSSRACSCRPGRLALQVRHESQVLSPISLNSSPQTDRPALQADRLTCSVLDCPVQGDWTRSSAEAA